MSKKVEIDIAEAQLQLLQLAELVRSGGRVVVTRMGEPYLDLVPHWDNSHLRTPGILKGKVVIKTGVEEAQDDIIDEFGA